MPTRYEVVYDDDHARAIAALAREFDVTEEEVLRQLVDVGLAELEDVPTTESSRRPDY